MKTSIRLTLQNLLIFVAVLSVGCQRQSAVIEEVSKDQGKASQGEKQAEQSRPDVDSSSMGQSEDVTVADVAEDTIEEEIVPQKPSCLEVLEQRFGEDRIYYPAMHLFPEIYKQAQDAGANGLRLLREKLAEKECEPLPRSAN